MTLLYLALPSCEMAVTRVAERVRQGGHNIPRDLIQRRYFRSLSNFFDVYSNLVDHVVCYCNADQEPRAIFQKYGEEKDVFDRETLQSLLKFGNHELD